MFLARGALSLVIIALLSLAIYSMASPLILGVRQRFVLTRQTPRQRHFREDYLYSNSTKILFGVLLHANSPTPRKHTKKNGKRGPWNHLDQSPIPSGALEWTPPLNRCELHS